MHNTRVPFMLLLDALTLIIFARSFPAVATAVAAMEGMVLSHTAQEMNVCLGDRLHCVRDVNVPRPHAPSGRIYLV